MSAIQIVESFSAYKPTVDAREAVAAVLATVPNEYLFGLGKVMLSDARGLNRAGRRKKTRHRGKTRQSNEAIGTYHQAWQGQKAYITLFVDNIVAQCPTAMKIPTLRNLVFADVLFHEIGHHIHSTRTKEFRQREDVADDWIHRLAEHYLRRRRWYLRPLAKVYKLDEILNMEL